MNVNWDGDCSYNIENYYLQSEEALPNMETFKNH